MIASSVGTPECCQSGTACHCVVRASTNMETEVFSCIFAAVAAEILVDNVRIVAGTGLEEEVRSQLMQAERNLAYIFSTGAVLLAAWAFDQVISQCCRDKGEKEVEELHFCGLQESVVIGVCQEE